MEGLHSYSARLLLFISFCVVQLEVIQALNDSSAHIANTFSKEGKACLNGSCSRAASDDEDKSGFIHSVWAIFLFSLLGIIAFVAFLILVLRVLCAGKQKEQKPDTEQIIPPKSTFRDTPAQREIIPAQNPTYEEEAQIDELYAKPNKNFRGDNFQPQNAGLQYQTPLPTALPTSK
ncbi:hypothetical protein Ocin01_07548 [Orchesella cincta]|uniref:Uncharacterized protein n=1 Tax=Orchesella cincta TaxID=48709 RepID=A0A1D2N1M8_ORCCI|nr:hypothetical protein Ocin01_07548 [Orchesella cincta]